MREPRSSRASPPATDPAAPRHPYGPRSLAALLPDVTGPALARQTSAGARIAADWSLIVGARLGEITAPRKLAAGTLTIACAGPIALEIQHIADLLIERINRHMGHALVERLRLAQESLTPIAPRALARPHAPRSAAMIASRLGDLPDGPVRAALAALAAAMDD